MRQTTQNARHGIQWTMFSQLEDLDYVDDIAQLSINARHLRQKEANFRNENAKKASLHINMKKTKVMHLNLTEPHPQILIDGENLEAVDDFTYLATLVPRTMFRRISNRLPAGICAAPCIFQRLMDALFAGIPVCLCVLRLYILASGKTMQDHDKNLDLVFTVLWDAGFKVRGKSVYWL